MDADWETVTKRTFDKVQKDRKLSVHTVMFCDPPITFFWDDTLPREPGWAQYDYAILSIIRDRNLKTDRPRWEYRINRAVLPKTKRARSPKTTSPS